MKKMNRLLSFMVLGLAMTMTACDQPVPSSGQTVSFVVTFNTNEGSTISEITVNENGVVGTVEAPTKEGHNFAGWYLDSAFTQEVDLSTYVPTADITVYAKWTIESFDIKFEENGGSDVQDITVDYGTPITLPEAPTKEGYDFVKWYLDEELLRPYANQVVKEDTTLYAKWRSGLVYIGSETGEAVYNADGSYTFSVNLPLWGRFQLMYYGTPISANDENLTITGLFNPTNSADWSRNLYCDIPENGTEVDYTTFLCCNAGVYDITYDPASNTLDIQDGNPVVPIPETGFCYRYTQGASADLVDPITVELDAETNTYSFEVELAQWRYVEMYYNGVIVDSVDVDKAFNINGGNIYIGDGTDPTTSFYTSVANKYKFEYTPATGDAKAKVTTSLVIEIPETGVYYMYTNPENVLQAPKAATFDEATGTYAFEVGLAQWRYINIYKDGVALKFADLAVSGDGWVDGTYNASSTVGALYIPDSPEQIMRPAGEGVVNYKLVYNPVDNSLAIDNLSYEPAPAPTIPETGVYFLYTTNAAGTVYPATSDITEENGAYSITVGLDKWKWVAVYKDGQPLAVADMNVSGDGWVDGTYDNSTNGSLYIPEDATQLMRSQAGVVDYKLTYNPTDNTLVIDNLALSDQPSDAQTYTFNDGDYYALFAESGATVNVLEKYRLYVAIDAEGKIAYMCEMPINGYSVFDSPRKFVCHSDYADINNNPAMTISGSSYSIVVPQGGQILEMWTGSANVQAFMVDVTGLAYAECAINTNATSINVDNVRIVSTETAGNYKVERVAAPVKTEIPVLSTEADSATIVWDTAGKTAITSQDGTSFQLANGWRLYIVVDSEGKIAYMVHSPATGYGGAYSNSYIRHSDYADYKVNPAFTNLSEPLENQWGLYVKYNVVVPEGGFAICAHGGEANAIMQAILGVDSTVDININTNNVDDVRLTYDAANAKIIISK